MDPGSAPPDQPQGWSASSLRAGGLIDVPIPVGSGRSVIYGFGAGFGLALVVIAVTASTGPGGIIAALGAGLLLGRVYLGRRWVAFAGLFVGVLGWAMVAGRLAASPPHEWSGLDGFALGVTIVGYLVLTGVGLLIGGRAPSHPPPEGTLARLLGATGLIAFSALVVTFGALVYAPASASFEITLPPGWHVLPRTAIPWDENIAFGDDYTAVYGTTEVPAALDVPVVGVTTVRAGDDGSPEACYRSMNTWAGPGSPLYDGAIVASTEIVELPVGPAHYEVRAGDNGGSAVRVHGYGIVRGRLVGVLPEQICYILAITVPPGGAITEADARAIAESFRFR